MLQGVRMVQWRWYLQVPLRMWCSSSHRPANLWHQAGATRMGISTIVVVAQFMFDSLQPQGVQHARPPCPSPSPEVCPSSCPFYLWCPPGISSSDALFSFCPQSFPASGTFPMSQLFTSDDQNTGALASASALPTSIQGWFPLRLTSLVSFLSKGLSGVFSSTTVQRHHFFGVLTSLQYSSHSTWPLGRP